MTHNAVYFYDMDTTPLQIKTDSAVGSQEQLHFASSLADEGLSWKVIVKVLFSDPIQYKLSWCNEFSNFSVDLPAEQNKIWTITETATTVKIACNEVEVMTYTFSYSTMNDCVKRWATDSAVIRFGGSHDTASDEFRAEPGIHFKHIPLSVFISGI